MDKDKQWYVEDDDIHFRLSVIKEMEAVGANWLSREGLVYQRLRFWETDGKYGFMVEGEQSMSEHFAGSTPEQIRTCLKNLQKKGLIHHVQCDKRVYRNKTKVWMSAARLAGSATAVDAIKVLDHNRKNTAHLADSPLDLKATEVEKLDVQVPPTGCSSPTNWMSKSQKLDVQVPPNRGTNKNRNKNEYIFPAYAKPGEGLDSVGSQGEISAGGVVKITTPFESTTTVPVNVKNTNPNRFVAPLATELLKLAGEGAVKAGPALRSAVQARLKQGYTAQDLKAIVLAGKEDEFYADKPVATMLSENGASALLKKSKRGGGGKAPRSRLAQIYGD